MNRSKQDKKLIIFMIFILLISFSLIFSINTTAFDDTSETDINENDNDNRFIIEVIELEEEMNYEPYQNPTSSNRYTIRYPKENIKVIPPDGSKITGVTDDSIKIIINEKSAIIQYNKTVSKFCPVNFKSSVKGTNDFTMVIYYNDDFFYESTNDFNNYIIEWGNGNVTKGNGTIPSLLSYNYDKEGEYPLTITLTDNQGVKYIYQRNQTYKLTADQFIKLWTIENKETVAAGSAGTIGILTLIGIALTETGKYKLLALLLLALPMFTKIQKEDVLDHFVRGQIYGYIKAYPGAHYNQIMRELDIKNGTLSYHLYILEKTGTIKSRKEGFRYRAFYPTEVKFPEEERYRLTELQINIIKLIQENKGINQKNISKKLNENHQTISYNIKVLQQAGIINTNRKGRKTCCFFNQQISDKLPL